MTDPRVVAAGSDVDQRIAAIDAKLCAQTSPASGSFAWVPRNDVEWLLATLRETRAQLADADEFREEVERTSGALGHSAIAFPSISAHARAVREALEPFARMYRPGSDPREVACERGVASDLTLITSGDFERAAKVIGHE